MKSHFTKVISGAAVAAALLPGIASAATLADLLKTVSDLINMIVPILIALAIVYFLWGVVSYLMAPGGVAKDEARNHMIWGVIAIAVMVSVWGLVGILRSTFNIEDNTAITPATVKFDTTAH